MAISNTSTSNIRLPKIDATTAAVFPQQVTFWEKIVANHLTNRPDAQLPEREVLDDIVSGQLSPDDLNSMTLEPYEWFDSLLACVNWWRELADCALQGLNSDDAERGPRPELAHTRSTLSSLLGNVLAAYAKAYQETSSAYSQEWGGFDEGLTEFLRQYRMYTSAVELLVLEVFPKLNRDLLLHPDFGWLKPSRLEAVA